MYSRQLAAEVEPLAIRVNAIAPGTILTPCIVAQSSKRGIGEPSQVEAVALRRHGVADDIAKVAEFLLSDPSSFVTGQVIAVNGGRTLCPA